MGERAAGLRCNGFGKVSAHLFASTGGTDTDWIVKFNDVYPEKQQPNAPADAMMAALKLMIAGDLPRGRYRKSIQKPEPIMPLRNARSRFRGTIMCF